MAVISKKDKLIEEAQKLTLRGQFDKAAKLYEQAITLEPSAINLRQKLAELLVKAGRLDDARKELEMISKHFSKNGFFLKAIAVCKQLQKLFPTDISLSLSLAELNEKHGLTANAISEYKLVYDYYQKTGDISEQIKILDKMQAVDSSNVAIKIKLAEACYQNNQKDEAYALFSKTATLLQERGDNAALTKLNARIQQLFPDRTEFMLETLTEQVKSGNAARAVSSLQELLRSNTSDKRVWDLVIEAYRRLDQPQRVKIAYQHYLKYFPTDPTPMIGLISCYAAEHDLSTALELLNRHESNLYSAGILEQLEKIYRALDAIDPINVRILEGLIKITKATGNKVDLETFSAKRQSLNRVSGTFRPETTNPEQEANYPAKIEQFETCEDQGSAPKPAEFAFPESVEFSANSEPEITDEEDIEIEIDIDSEGYSDQTGDNDFDSNWLDSVGGLFGTISTSPSSVRFGNKAESSDAQSHFDLGLAFKEMGLYDEAINEFRQASLDPTRKLACLIMQGACLRERGDYDNALSMLSALLKPNLSRDDSSAVKYELAITFESAGKTDRARQLLNEVNSSNHGFRDVSSRLNASNLENSLDFSDEELDDFDLK